jgi:hypothetical protein
LAQAVSALPLGLDVLELRHFIARNIPGTEFSPSFFSMSAEQGEMAPPSKAGSKAIEKLLTLFPTIFSLFIVGVYIMPLWMLYHAGNDPNVQQWITKHLWVPVLVLPLVYFAVHMLHLVRRTPSKPAVVLTLYGSAVVLLIAAEMLEVNSYAMGNAMMAMDCDASDGKRAMQNQYMSAVTFYANCAQTVATSRNITFGQAVATYRIRDCPGYLEQANSDWAYLAYLEDSYQCSGWCEERPSLFTHRTTKDSCQSVVADVFLNKVKFTMVQVIIYNIVVLTFVSIVSLRVGPVLRKFGIPW